MLADDNQDTTVTIIYTNFMTYNNDKDMAEAEVAKVTTITILFLLNWQLLS